jgi:nucleoid-associated protein YgaU
MATTAISSGSLGVDYSLARPSPTALADAGVKFVCRYLANLPNGKVIDASERDALWAAGLGVLLNWEQASGDFLIRTKGAAQGAEAAKQAAALGYPTSLPVIVSCDSDATTVNQLDDVEEYFRNFQGAAGGQTIGVYGQAQIANRLLAAGIVNFVWAPNATSWNRGVAYDRVDIQQHYGESSYPALRQFGDEIDPDTTAQDITVWTGPGDSSGGGSGGSTSAGRTYTVKANDSWWGIAQAELGSGSRDSELAAYNGKTLAEPIHPGEVLKLP